MNEQYKPCPICGGTELEVSVRLGWRYITCDACGATGAPGLDELGAWENWDTRPGDVWVQVIIDALIMNAESA